jgi:multidrug efflux pump subunit AcrB
VKLAAFSVRRWQFTILMFLMLVAIGVASWKRIPRGEDPVFPIPTFMVIVVYPGASPSDMEQLVVDKIEDKLGALEGVWKLFARAEDGLATIRIEFEPSVDADRKEDEVLREMNALRAELPAGLARLQILRASATNVSILQAALVSETAPYAQLDSIAKQFEKRLERLESIKKSERWAAPTREVQVALNLDKLARAGIPPMQVMQAIGSDNVSIPGGSVDAGTRRFNLVPQGRYRTLEEVQQTVVGGSRAGVVRLQDVADVRWGYGDPTHIGRWSGERAVFVTAAMKESANITVAKAEMWPVLDELERTLPRGVKLVRGFDQAANVDRRLSRLGADFAIALSLVLLTLLPLGPRASAIVMTSIPLSLSIAIALLDVTGYSINQLSIVGFVIALGLLVDDSIVVVENISRFLRAGHSRRDAAVQATRQIAVAVMGATATLIFAFLPLIFLPGLPGRYMRSLPLAVVYAVLASLFVSFTIVPWLASRIMPVTSEKRGNRWLQLLEGGIQKTYAPVLHRALANPYRTLLFSVILILSSFALVPVVGFSLFPKAGTPQFLVNIETAEGTTIAATDSVARIAERIILKHPNTRGVFTNVGKDNPFVYYNTVPRAEAGNIAQLFVLQHEYLPRSTPQMIDSLRATLAQVPGARIEVREFENGPPIDAPIAIRIEGPDLDTLRALSARVERVMAATPGTQYVRDPLAVSRTDLALRVDRQKAGLLGVATVELDRTVRLGVAGLEAGKFRASDGEEYPITVRVPRDGRPTSEILDRIHVASTTGAMIPLNQLAQLGFKGSPNVITHFNQVRSATVTSYVLTGYNTDRVTKEVLATLESLKLPPGYRLIPAGEIESRQESFGGIGNAIIVAIFGIMAILVLEFRTFKSTLVVASVIPLGIVGGIVALWLSGNTLSFAAMIGFVALIGIEIKTSILLVDFTDELRRQGYNLDDAIQRAGEVRFVPIVLTSMTAIGGMLPLALQGSSLYSPLAWVIIGGLVSSTLIARLVTPVMYRLLAPRLEFTEEHPIPDALTERGGGRG